jgi:hypothetical protein
MLQILVDQKTEAPNYNLPTQIFSYSAIPENTGVQQVK